MDNWLNRTEYLIGKEPIEKLKNVHVAVFGLGGVGSYTIEALARSGIGHLTLVDKDIVDSVLVVPPYMGDGIPTGNQTIVYTRKALYYGAF